MIDGRDGLVAPEKKKGENKEKNTLLRLRNALKNTNRFCLWAV